MRKSKHLLVIKIKGPYFRIYTFLYPKFLQNGGLKVVKNNFQPTK